MKKKMRTALVLALVTMLLGAAALAIGLTFSPRYDAVRLANEALESTYGITPVMMTVLHRADAERAADGSDVIRYGSVESQWAERIGVYTVTVRDNSAEAAWSHDGETITEGFASPVWGAEQIGLILSDYAGANMAVRADSAPLPMPDPEEIAANQKRLEENAAAAKALANITLEEARALALEAIAQEYALTDEQLAALQTDEEDFTYYRMENEQPVIVVAYWLMQAKDGSYVEGDGQYWVTVHAETGVIEDVLYDSGLAGNG